MIAANCYGIFVEDLDNKVKCNHQNELTEKLYSQNYHFNTEYFSTKYFCDGNFFLT